VSIGDENDKGMFIWDMNRSYDMVNAVNRVNKRLMR